MNTSTQSWLDSIRRGARRALGALVLTACVSGCNNRARLPGPVTPLVPTPDEQFRSKHPAVATPESFGRASMPQAQEVALDNGLSVWVVTRPALPFVALSYVARGAGSLSGAACAELVTLTTRAMIAGGTLWTNGTSVEPPTIHGRGVSYAVLPSHVELQLPVLRSALAGGIEVLARTVRSPAWEGPELDSIRLAELRRQQQSTNRSSLLLKLAVDGAYGPEVGALFPPLETDLLKTAALADIRGCHQQNFRPEQSALIAVGNATLAEVHELGARAFGSWPRAGKRANAPAPTRKSSGRRVHFLPIQDDDQATLMLLQPAPTSERSADLLPFSLLAEVAVGAFHSRANTELRHHAGLTYGVRPGSVRSQRLGLMTVEATVESSEVTESIHQLLATLEALETSPVSNSELERAKLAYAADLERDAGDNLALSRLLAQAFADGNDSKWLSGLPDVLSAVTTADLQRVARQYLDPDNVEIGVTGGLGLATRLASIGPVSWVEASAEP